MATLRWTTTLLGLYLAGGLSGIVQAASDPAIEESHGQAIEGKLYYPGSLEFYEEVFSMKSGSPNHPDSSQFAIGKDACPAFAGTDSIYYRNNSGYGAFEGIYCLNLITGFVYSEVRGSSEGAIRKEVGPSELSRDQIAYARALEKLSRGALEFRKGNYYPMYGFMAPERPALQLAVDYLSAVEARYLSQAGDYLEVYFPKEAFQGSEINLMPSILTHKNLELIAVQRDESQIYSTERFPVPVGFHPLNITLYTPTRVNSLKTYVVTLALVPQGAGLEAALDKIEKPILMHGDSYLTYLFCQDEKSGASSVSCTLGAKTAENLDIRLDVFSEDGRWLAGVQKEVGGGYTASDVALELKEPLPPGRYTVYGKLLPKGGVWSNAFEEVSASVDVGR